MKSLCFITGAGLFLAASSCAYAFDITSDPDATAVWVLKGGDVPGNPVFFTPHPILGVVAGTTPATTRRVWKYGYAACQNPNAIALLVPVVTALSVWNGSALIWIKGNSHAALFS